MSVLSYFSAHASHPSPNLRIPAVHGAKTTKKRPPSHMFFCLKSVIQSFERQSGCKIIKQKVPGGLIFSGFSTMYNRYPYEPSNSERKLVSEF